MTVQAPIEQALHGYDEGHRLLAASTSLSPALLRLMDRLSDAAGATVQPDLHGYITGYPLPDGRYAFARTWPATEVPRPNCVWTHTLILQSEHLVSDGDLSRWPLLFRRPEHPLDRAQYASAIHHPRRTGELPRAPATTTADSRERLCRALYTADDSLAWLELPNAPDRDALALAIWAQMWPALRRRVAFCTGAPEPRRVGDRLFDLCLVPSGAGRAFRAYRLDKFEANPVWSWLAADLVQPSQAFREFAHFVAGGSTRRSVMVSLARICSTLSSSDREALLAVIVAEVDAVGPEPEQARRLKRALFRLPNAAVASHLSAQTVLEALVLEPLASRVMSDDSSLAAWVAAAWREGPARVLELAAGSHSSQELRPIVRDLALRQASPSHLGLLARSWPDVAWQLVESNAADKRWVRAFVRLTTGEIADVLRNTEPSAGALAAAARELVLLDGQDAMRKWLLLADVQPAAVFDASVTALRERPAAVTRWRETISSIDIDPAVAIERATSADLPVLAEVLEPTQEVLSLGPAPWRPLSADQVHRLERGTAVVFLAALHKPTSLDSDLIAYVYAELFQRFANSDASVEWSVLQHRLDGSPQDWDRCSRLSRTLAKEIARLDDNVGQEVVRRVASLDPTAATQLEHALSLRKKPKFKLFGIELG